MDEFADSEVDKEETNLQEIQDQSWRFLLDLIFLQQNVRKMDSFVFINDCHLKVKTK